MKCVNLFLTVSRMLRGCAGSVMNIDVEREIGEPS